MIGSSSQLLSNTASEGAPHRRNTGPLSRNNPFFLPT